MNQQILAFLLLVVLIHNAEKSILMQCVLVYHLTSECLQVADQNVLQVPNVHKTRHVYVKNAQIHVLEHVGLTQDVKF